MCFRDLSCTSACRRNAPSSRCSAEDRLCRSWIDLEACRDQRHASSWRVLAYGPTDEVARAVQRGSPHPKIGSRKMSLWVSNYRATVAPRWRHGGRDGKISGRLAWQPSPSEGSPRCHPRTLRHATRVGVGQHLDRRGDHGAAGQARAQGSREDHAG